MVAAVNKTRLFLVGNGFDLAHGLPTRFDPDFKDIAIGKESDSMFWDLYQTEEANIWSDFESLLAKPDFDELGQIFDAYTPDYTSDHEYDRDSIITQADISGKLYEALLDFATIAESELSTAKPRYLYRNLFTKNDLYVNFNYTHTLEKLYGIPNGQVLHIHGETGGNDKLLLGYDAAVFDAGTISEDVTGRGRYRSVPTKDYIDGIEDFYIRIAYENLHKNIASWGKPLQSDKLSQFVGGVAIDEIVVIGFSFGKVDAAYFDLLQKLNLNCKFTVTAHDELRLSDYQAKINAHYAIKNYEIELL